SSAWSKSPLPGRDRARRWRARTDEPLPPPAGPRRAIATRRASPRSRGGPRPARAAGRRREKERSRRARKRREPELRPAQPVPRAADPARASPSLDREGTAAPPRGRRPAPRPDAPAAEDRRSIRTPARAASNGEAASDRSERRRLATE